jgi:hypothetical protein
MSRQTRRHDVDWGHLIFIFVIAAWVLWYLVDALSVSFSTHNLLFIGPVGVLALLLCLLIVPQCISRRDVEPRDRRPARTAIGMPKAHASGKGDLLRIGGVAVSLGLFVCLLNVIGFDVATCLFALAVMFICGERRAHVLILYSLGVALVVVLGFRAILPFPMYTTVL